MIDTSDNSKRIRVYFLGSGEIGIRTIEQLSADSRIDLIGCGTQPDRPQGRKRIMKPTPIGHWCEEHAIKVDKFESINNDSSISHLQSLDIDIMLVFAYGQILSQDVLDIPAKNCINIHASLLPKYRGASPINAVILS